MKNIFVTMNTVIQIAHCTKPTHYYKISTRVPLCITQKQIIQSGTSEALVFIIKYLNCYDTDDEISAPEYPLLENIELKDLFELEQHIFADTLHLQNITFVGDLLAIAQELQARVLVQKLAAITAYNMQLL